MLSADGWLYLMPIEYSNNRRSSENWRQSATVVICQPNSVLWSRYWSTAVERERPHSLLFFRQFGSVCLLLQGPPSSCAFSSFLLAQRTALQHPLCVFEYPASLVLKYTTRWSSLLSVRLSKWLNELLEVENHCNYLSPKASKRVRDLHARSRRRSKRDSTHASIRCKKALLTQISNKRTTEVLCFFILFINYR